MALQLAIICVFGFGLGFIAHFIWDAVKYDGGFENYEDR